MDPNADDAIEFHEFKQALKRATQPAAAVQAEAQAACTDCVVCCLRHARITDWSNFQKAGARNASKADGHCSLAESVGHEWRWLYLYSGT